MYPYCVNLFHLSALFKGQGKLVAHSRIKYLLKLIWEFAFVAFMAFVCRYVNPKKVVQNSI